LESEGITIEANVLRSHLLHDEVILKLVYRHYQDRVVHLEPVTGSPVVVDIHTERVKMNSAFKQMNSTKNTAGLTDHSPHSHSEKEDRTRGILHRHYVCVRDAQVCSSHACST
jgi:succinate dehydrogenase/fumarate reductase-like Fe-S protein